MGIRVKLRASALLSVMGAAIVLLMSAVAVQAGVPIYQINSGGGAVGTWSYDQFYSGSVGVAGVSNAIDTGIFNPAPVQVYQHERYGAMTYTFPNLTPGASYTVRLHFCEIYYTTTGKRLFNVSINGNQVLTNYDIVAVAGSAFKANIQQFAANADSSGKITVSYTQGLADLPKSSGIEIIDGAPRAMWVWNGASIVTDTSAQSSLFSFLAAPRGVSSRSINTIFCAINLSQLSDPTAAPQVRSFLASAHNNGVRVYFLCGDPSWATSAGESYGLQWLNGVLSFNAGGTSATDFDGFQYDVEPYLLADWPSAADINGMIALLDDSNTAIRNSGQTLTFSAVMPFWYDSPTYNYLDHSIIDRTNETAIMDYVTTAANLQNYPSAEVAYANQAGKKTWIGVETTGPASSSTFYGFGNAYMENVLSSSLPYYEAQPSYAGYAIHDYNGYVNLAP